MHNRKIANLEGLFQIVSDAKQSGKRIVQCHGCFDILHIGHIKHLQAAKKEGDILVVTLTPDRFIQKGPGRPYFNENLRLEQIAALECVDYVALSNNNTAVDVLKLLKPDVYVKGKEVINNSAVDAIDTKHGRKSNLGLEEEVVRSYGGRLYLTDEETFSSSRIINEITDSIPSESKEYLREFKLKHKSEDISKILNSFRGIRILSLGDAILDEYVFCQSMEKSGKEAIVAYKFLSSEVHPGGVLAIANHLSEFSDNVSVLTSIGDNHSSVIEKGLNPKIENHIFRIQGLETLVKKRYVNQYKNIKVFEIYNKQSFDLNEELEEKVISFLNNEGQGYDLIVASDFGHGFMTPKIIETVSKTKNFLSVSTQLNGGNLGYNFITKYPRADFVSLNDRELRLPLQASEEETEDAMIALTNRLNLSGLNVTLGKKGSIFYSNNSFYSAPAFANRAIDTVGAGDAVLAVGSMCAYKQINPEIFPFIVNSVGALAVKIVGNREAVKLNDLNKFVNYILK